ncbi:MAG TPA: IS1380 family transposase, partial [Rikenellaceae bacterium]|nr:IS1380 family transposase [Rikenellaceae bacterium]
MAKIQLKSDNINPFGGLFSIFRMFDRSGLRSVIDGHLGRRGRTKAAFTHGDVFASMFG